MLRILVTGAFGNLGTATLDELIASGHHVRAFDRRSLRNRRLAARYGDRIEVVWGDIRSPEAVRRAAAGQERVLHLAFIIPSVSAPRTSRGFWKMSE